MTSFERFVIRSQAMSVKHILFSEIVNSKGNINSVFIFDFKSEPLKMSCCVAVRLNVQIIVSMVL